MLWTRLGSLDRVFEPGEIGIGSDALAAQPFMLATSDRVLLGEELYAAGAYLNREPAQVASLYVQDVLRGLAIVAIVIGILFKTFT